MAGSSIRDGDSVVKKGASEVEGRRVPAPDEELKFLEALKLYPKAVGWSVFFSLGVVMTGFDPQLIGQLFATPAFQRDFGYLYKDSYIITATWQTGLSMGNPIGQVVGAFFAAYPMEWFGRKKTFGACVVLTTAFVFIQFFARSLEVLLAGELLSGLVLGTYVVVAPAYASEVCPVELRGVLTSYINLCFVIGQLLANGVVAGTSQLDNHWAYSGAFAAQWFWPLIIFIGWPFAPESPWHLVRKDDHAGAEAALRRLASPSIDVLPTLDAIIATDRLERDLAAGTRYRDVFRPINRRRTEISVGVYCIQVVSGVYLVNYMTYFFQLAGLPTSASFNMSVGSLALGVVGTLVSWVLLVRFGRRSIYTIGFGTLVAILFVVGILDCIPGYLDKPGLAWAQSSLLLVWTGIYDLSVGPICFVILCEVSATRVRAKTIAVATAAQAVLGIIMTVAIPYLINPDEAGGRGKIGFFFGGLAFIGLVWSYLRVPETKGRSYEELDLMFSRGLRTREFKNHVVEY